MADRVRNVLFLCTGNSARSIFGECLINHWGEGRFRGFSAGSHPKGAVHPLTLEVLRRRGYPVDGLRSKDWQEFAQPGAPAMDFVFTVCDRAAAESCPIWPGHPITAHWGIPDPAAAEGDDAARISAFQTAFIELETRIKIFVNLPLGSIDIGTLQKTLDDLGHTVLEQEGSMG